MEKRNNWLICGTSPFAMGRLDCIKYSDFITVGLNYFPVKCDYRFIVDHSIIHKCYQNGERLVIHNQLVNELGDIKPYLIYSIGKELDVIWSVCEPAIEYAYKQGADNIILFGVDLGGDFQPKEQTDVTKAIIRKYGNVYTLNKEAEIGVPTWTETNLN